MKRRDFITKAGLGTAAVAGAALAAPAVAQERKVLTCVSSWPKRLSWSRGFSSTA